ncbi:TMV resistance protein N-like [Ziziphus jujuba]|uniref:TMV resistance protein N-like n=1 Tax=Ziziphus jujuba TaxID=326968 RepID=A0ABM4AB60_ZIZJJ|nr:TMV resistance protein N-like [Ziziphus jujuba]
MAFSSLSSPIFPEQRYEFEDTYDVFMSFRGDDTLNTFASYLYGALSANQILTSIDHELDRGEEMSPILRKAIKESKISVIIFSENYASSIRCLDELLQILECRRTKGQIVMPIFYHIDPSMVQNQKANYGVAFVELEHHFKDIMEKVQKWKDALTEASNLHGFDSKAFRLLYARHGSNYLRKKLHSELLNTDQAILKMDTSFIASPYIFDKLRYKKVKMGLSVFIEKSLIEDGKYWIDNKLWMHDLLRQMGQKIACDRHTEPGDYSRLWDAKDVCHVLERNTGTIAVKFISFNMSGMMRDIKACRLDSYLSKKQNYFHWDLYPLKSLPSNFTPKNLVELRLRGNHVEKLWNHEVQPFFCITTFFSDVEKDGSQLFQVPYRITRFVSTGSLPGKFKS